jgi:hypothetical protein
MMPKEQSLKMVPLDFAQDKLASNAAMKSCYWLPKQFTASAFNALVSPP